MSKNLSVFVCQQCGYQSPSFLGKCPNCDSWNSFVEEIKNPARIAAQSATGGAKPVKLSEIKAIQTNRMSTGISELDLVLGGGLVPGMAVLLAGEPGIGKSTLLLQLAGKINGVVLYVAGEESASQIKIRAERLKVKTDNLLVLEETDVDLIRSHLGSQGETLPNLIIVDSIQTLTIADLSGTAGSVGQVRECAARLINACKSKNIPLFLVGHVTKEGTIAGPKVLEHAVDTILNLEGEKYTSLRLLRTTKNRFGPTDEVGLFEMKDTGLVVTAPKLPEINIQTGSCLTVTMEGTRPILAEIQALVTNTPLPNPRRVASGINYNRLQTIVAILQKRFNLPLYKEDVYVSVVGGLKIEEPAADLAVALAILSSYKNKALPAKTVAIGELDLLGNVRPVNSQPRRVKEAKKLGFHILSTLSSD